ncbi:hypothetical protein [uncultured Ruegeria sp.]|uniref:hypothetical protein n=1 Tax=uncultured Ruegeria sp. TaxID=259304 RepID=UPI0026281E10|nr:hypothetical protein [uncultured Ruegeria sp.]
MIDKLWIVHYVVSLGRHCSLIFRMGTEALMQTSFRLEGAQLARCRNCAGDGVFWPSVGLEDPEDQFADLAQVL